MHEALPVCGGRAALLGNVAPKVSVQFQPHQLKIVTCDVTGR